MPSKEFQFSRKSKHANKQANKQISKTECLEFNLRGVYGIENKAKERRYIRRVW